GACWRFPSTRSATSTKLSINTLRAGYFDEAQYKYAQDRLRSPAGEQGGIISYFGQKSTKQRATKLATGD
ncbi:MAG: hypothetical protein ACYS8Y_10800, partial [Planctomycetota bacterium]